MANRRTLLPLFQTKNRAYRNAIVSVLEADATTFEKTTQLATLYSSLTDSDTISNPITLDENGRSQTPIYSDKPVIAVIEAEAVGEHETGVYEPIVSAYRGDWQSGVTYYAGDTVTDGSAGAGTNGYYQATEMHESTVWSSDLSDYWDSIIDIAALNTSVTAAASSATAAATSASAAASSASTALAAQEIAEAVTGYSYTFSTNTAASNPEFGYLKFNNAALASATALYISEITGLVQSIDGDLDSWDDGNSVNKGRLIITSSDDATRRAIFNVRGTQTDNGSWRTFTVSFVDDTFGGTFSNNENIHIMFMPNSTSPFFDDDGTYPSPEPSATGSEAIAIAQSAVASGNYSLAIGLSSSATHESAVALGYASEARANYSLALGYDTNATAASTVAIGDSADATASLAVAIGANSTCAKAHAVAMQYGAISRFADGFTFGGHAFSNDGGGQTHLGRISALTTNNTVTEMFTPFSAEKLVLQNNSTWAFRALIVARRTDVDGEGAVYELTGAIDRNANAASTALIGSVTKTVIAEDTAGWDVAADADTTNGALRFQVTGENTKTIRWYGTVWIAEITE